MKPDGDPSQDPSEENSENTPEAGVSRWQRLKRLVISRYLRVIDALSGVLKRLRKRAGKPVEEDGQREEREEPRGSRKPAKTPHPDQAPAAAPPAPRGPVRSLFIYLLVLIVGIIAGMIFSFALLSNMVINQAQKIGDQRDEISQLENQYSKALESQAKYRNRLSDVESQLNQLTQRIGKEAPAEPANPPATAKEKSPISAKTGNCTLESGNAEELARCIDDFNRKGGKTGGR